MKASDRQAIARFNQVMVRVEEYRSLQPKLHIPVLRALRFGLEKLAEKSGTPDPAECEKLRGEANAALFEVTEIGDDTLRLEAVEALLGCPTPPDATTASARLLMGRVVEKHVDECALPLYQAGFRLRDDEMDRELVAYHMGRGSWPSPEVLMPDLLQSPQMSSLVRGLLSLIAERGMGRNAQIALDTLDRVEAWQKQCGNPDLGPALTTGFNNYMQYKSQVSNLAGWSRGATELLSRLIELGMEGETGVAIAREKDEYGGRKIESMLADALQLSLERQTLNAPLPSRLGIRL